MTEALGEKPVAIWLGHRDSELVLCAACKSESRSKRWIISLWGVERGLHKKQTLVSASIRPQHMVRMALNKLLPLFGSNGRDASDVKIQEFIFSDKQDEFWEFVEKQKMHRIIVRSRLSVEMQRKVIEQRLAPDAEK